MRGKYKLCFLIFCVYLSQRIVALSKAEIDASLNLQAHQTKASNYGRDISKEIKIEDSPYIVNIYQNLRRVCSGSILSSTVVITVAACISENMKRQKYTIYSGTSNVLEGKRHQIVKKIEQIRDKDVLNKSSLVLIQINPPIDLVKSPNRAIALYPITDVTTNTQAKYSGWKCVDVNSTALTKNLNSVNVPLIDHATCLEFLSSKDVYTFSNKSLCTYASSGDKDTCLGDVGSPLVVKEHLIAVMSVVSPSIEGQQNIYECINLAEKENYGWVMTNQKKLQDSATESKKQ